MSEKIPEITHQRIHYNSLSNYLQQEYGEKLYKLTLSSGCTCPNRDGKCGAGGCIFCSSGGSGEFAAPNTLTLDEQIQIAKERISGKPHSDKYIAYFQSFTNTYGDLKHLSDLYNAVALRPDISVISIATRPDCLDDDVLRMLAEVKQKKPVWVELGLQTSNPDSARYIRRGYENEVYKRAVEKLNEAGIKVITHVIIGLPGETFEDYSETVKYACDCGTWGLKLQLLHVLEGTDLASDYYSDKVPLLTMEEYVDVICRLIEMIPPDVVIHRLTGDGQKKILIAPKWSGDKKRVLGTLAYEMQKRNIKQGHMWKTNKKR